MNTKRIGTVVRFGARGFGFVIDRGTQVEYFVNINDVIGYVTLYAGQQVEFQIGPPAEGARRPRAILVRPIGQPPARLDGGVR